ncbi:hypothetical protein, partial [Falsirhodobacter xinxiangensis]|uniref:hypothetical protein n=1 Tax=Falsirhodobacter xinxiangensis TaxID=2530049 RepID=UPI001C6FD2C9
VTVRFQGSSSLLELLPFVPPDVSLFKRDSMLRLLERSIDFERLNDCPIEITFTALDAETGKWSHSAIATSG